MIKGSKQKKSDKEIAAHRPESHLGLNFENTIKLIYLISCCMQNIRTNKGVQAKHNHILHEYLMVFSKYAIGYSCPNLTRDSIEKFEKIRGVP